MKRMMAVMMIGSLLCGTGTVFAGTAEKKAVAPAMVMYTCPMHPEVVSRTPGKCPKCGMNLVPVQPVADKESKKAKKFICTMCAGVSSDAPGKCPHCGMNLVPEKSSGFQVNKDGSVPPAAIYTCPNCVDEKSAQPGACPKCGMPLVKWGAEKKTVR